MRSWITLPVEGKFMLGICIYPWPVSGGMGLFQIICLQVSRCCSQGMKPNQGLSVGLYCQHMRHSAVAKSHASVQMKGAHGWENMRAPFLPIWLFSSRASCTSKAKELAKVKGLSWYHWIEIICFTEMTFDGCFLGEIDIKHKYLQTSHKYLQT